MSTTSPKLPPKGPGRDGDDISSGSPAKSPLQHEIASDGAERARAGTSEVELGVSRVEAFNKVLYQSGRAGRVLLWLLGLSIGLTMFGYALDLGLTTAVFNTMASSTFGLHSQLGAVATASQIIRSVSKPFIGQLSDITSRPTSYVVTLGFYVLGFVVAATSSTFGAYTVGICFTAIGKSGLDLLGEVIVGDLTPLQWRGFFNASLSLPFIVTVPVNGFLGAALVKHWRWGLGMFAIMMPTLLLPAIVTLYIMQRRGEKIGMVPMAESGRRRTGTATDGDVDGQIGRFSRWFHQLRRGLVAIDMIGLVLLGIAFTLILLPFAISKSMHGGWGNGRIIAMLVIGVVFLFVFGLYERY
ncbi:hypothetical protein K4F52_005684 [Lecanicillium sp. MT-2017a]|nr:hypothetical protein K4F52_005684 [Lecanicillium sp. MT-2017a]